MAVYFAAIGCDKCDGSRNSAGKIDGYVPSKPPRPNLAEELLTTSGDVPVAVGRTIPKFLYKGMNKSSLHSKHMKVPAWSAPEGTMTLNPEFLASTPGRGIVSNCGKLSKSTICDPNLRTVNTQAECHSPEDIYSQSPWRAPGSAPVIDSW